MSWFNIVLVASWIIGAVTAGNSIPLGFMSGNYYEAIGFLGAGGFIIAQPYLIEWALKTDDTDT